MANPLLITELVLRDAHQSLLATRLRIDDMLPIAAKLDAVGFWSMESWGGATFDACIRYLGEDPWDRLRQLKAAMPNTRQQMLLRGQNLLGYRHYADDVVEAFVERAAITGVDVFRIFDALNDLRNLETAIRATIKTGKHAQGTISYTVSPVHTVDIYVDMGKRLEDMGCHSICIKDMAGLLRPYVAFELVSRLKETCRIPIAMQSHATTGMSDVTNIKAAEAGIDMLDTAISSMSKTYGHSATESVVAILEGTERDPGLDLKQLEEIAAYFRVVRKKYAEFEGSLRGVDARILVAQVPGGMLTNMESQLRAQGASAAFDEVLKEIPRVRQDLGYIPLVTPTSQIVGTQAVMNVVLGERYKNVTKETRGILSGEYGATPMPVDANLQRRVLGDAAADHGPPGGSHQARAREAQRRARRARQAKGLRKSWPGRRAHVRAVSRRRVTLPRAPRRRERVRAGAGQPARRSAGPGPEGACRTRTARSGTRRALRRDGQRQELRRRGRERRSDRSGRAAGVDRHHVHRCACRRSPRRARRKPRRAPRASKHRSPAPCCACSQRSIRPSRRATCCSCSKP